MQACDRGPRLREGRAKALIPSTLFVLFYFTFKNIRFIFQNGPIYRKIVALVQSCRMKPYPVSLLLTSSVKMVLFFSFFVDD